MITRNKISKKQTKRLLEVISKFYDESNLGHYDRDEYVLNTIKAIRYGIEGKAPNDIWCDEELNYYCFCKTQLDSDLSITYVLCVAWLDPKVRGLENIRKLINFIRFYAQKQGYKRLAVVTSRMDRYKAFKRGLGKNFTEKLITLTEEY